MNTQPSEKIDYSDLIEVEEIFWTLQGEGPLTGCSALFVRLSGCSLSCSWCVIGKTKVHTIHGKRWIKELNKGDLVYGVLNNQIVSRPITQVMQHTTDEVLKITFANQQATLTITKEHPGWIVGSGWVKSGDWKVGDVLFHITPSDTMTLRNPMKNQWVTEKVQDTKKTRTYPKRVVVKELHRTRMKTQNPMWDIEVRKKSWTNRVHSQSSTEKIVSSVIEHYALPIEFVGDGSFWVEGHCPDFKVTNQNKVIEVWDSTQSEFLGRDEKYCMERKKYFEDRGFECLLLPFSTSDFRMEGDAKGVGKEQCESWLSKTLHEFCHNGLVIEKIELINRWTKPKAYAALAGSLDQEIPVYNIEVEECHNYFANNVLVHNCDTLYSVNRVRMSVETLIEQIECMNPDRRLIVITGGEPFRQKSCFDLIGRLIELNHFVQIETSGSVCPDADLSALEKCVIVCSPKTSKISEKLIPYISCYKYVIDREVDSDGFPNISPMNGKKIKIARPMKNRLGVIPPIFVSPCDNEFKEQNTLLAIQLCNQYNVRLSLQVHKILNLR